MSNNDPHNDLTPKEEPSIGLALIIVMLVSGLVLMGTALYFGLQPLK